MIDWLSYIATRVLQTRGLWIGCCLITAISGAEDPSIHSSIYTFIYSSFRKIFNSFWRESVKQLLMYCCCLPVPVLIHQRRLLFWKKMHIFREVCVKSISNVLSGFYRCFVWLVPNDHKWSCCVTRVVYCKIDYVGLFPEHGLCLGQASLYDVCVLSFFSLVYLMSAVLLYFILLILFLILPLGVQ